MRTVYRHKPGAGKVIRAVLGLVVGLVVAAWFCYVIFTGDAPQSPNPGEYSPKPWEFVIPLALVLTGIAFALRLLSRAFIQKIVIEDGSLSKVNSWGRTRFRSPISQVTLREELDHMGERVYRVESPHGEFVFSEKLHRSRELRHEIMRGQMGDRALDG